MGRRILLISFRFRTRVLYGCRAALSGSLLVLSGSRLEVGEENRMGQCDKPIGCLPCRLLFHGSSTGYIDNDLCCSLPIFLHHIRVEIPELHLPRVGIPRLPLQHHTLLRVTPKLEGQIDTDWAQFLVE